MRYAIVVVILSVTTCLLGCKKIELLSTQNPPEVQSMNKYREYAQTKKLPPIPSTIKPLQYSNDAEYPVPAIVIGGLNLLGEKGYMCPTVSIISSDQESGEMFGWSLCLGGPDSQLDDEPYHFRTSEKDGLGTAKGTEIPNTMVYFQAEVDAELASPEADPQKLDEVIAYVIPYISDEGPPPSDGKSPDDLMEEIPTSAAEFHEVVFLKEKVTELLEQYQQKFSPEMDESELFQKLNGRLYDTGIKYAWKNNPSQPSYNPGLGIVERRIACFNVTVSFGLHKDGFDGPIAIFDISDL